MNNKKWHQIEDLADRALKLPAPERESFVKNVSNGDTELENEVIALLRSITDSEGWLEDPYNYKKDFFENITDELEVLDSKKSLVGKQVGSYTIIKEIGKGGMGTVFLAERSDGVFEHKVAIKLINPDRSTKENIERFKQERNILAELNHHGIAQIYDGGITSDDVPYFIMEFIEGIPITDYCILNRLSLNERLDLFKQVLKAVQHAHENLVIHQDLKPDNILVTKDGDVKILDFGISKLLKKDSAENKLIGLKQALTLTYAAPEQIRRQSVTTATDIYALGLVFHQSLTNRLPYSLDGLSVIEAQQKILTYRPAQLALYLDDESGLAKKTFSPDLEAILSKALQKNIRKRYRSAAALSSDLSKLKSKLPVSACEHTPLYLTKRYIQRNTKSLSVALLILTLIISFSAFYTSRITIEKEQAQIAAANAEEVSDFLIQLFEASDPESNLGNVFTTQELLKNGVQLSEQLSNQPLLQARLFDITGQVYRNIGNYEQAKYLIENAISLRERNLGYYHPITLASRHNLGLVMNDMGNFHEAENIFRLVYDQRRKTLGDGHVETASTLSYMAYSIRRQGDYELAEELARESLRVFINNLGIDNIQTLDVMNKLAITLHNKGDYEEAEELYLLVLKNRREKLNSPHPEIAKSINNLAALYLNRGQFSKAEFLLEEALEIHKDLFGPTHPSIAIVTNNLGLVHTELEEYEAAADYFNKALSMRLDILGPEHPNTAVSYYSIGGLMLAMNKPDSAFSAFEKAIPVFEEHHSEDHSFTVHSKFGIGRALSQKGLIEQATPYFITNFERIKEIHQAGSIERIMAEYHLGNFFFQKEDHSTADSLLQRSYLALKKIEGENGLRQERVVATLEQLKR